MKKKITVNLEPAKGFFGLLEVIDIREDTDSLESCSVSGLSDCSKLEVGSWLRKTELKRGGIRVKNKHILFVTLIALSFLDV